MAKHLSRMCPETNTDCFAYGAYGKCTACVDTNFNGKCPFYKTKEARKEQHEAAVRKLMFMGKHDLLSKYGREGCDEPSVWNEI